MSTKLTDRLATREEAKELGLLDQEFELICEKIGRKPTFTELAMYSGMWSEHCSYKNSILLLKNLYSKSDLLLADVGEENAGALKISDDHAIVFKIESHNHPSAVEPYQGAATGVGGIMRDVFTMGARPLVSLNSLRFGMPEDNQRTQFLLREVVKGIGDYGNSLGIPCAGGETFFHDSYTKNPLVNAMVVGIAKTDSMASSMAKGEGNLVMYVGAKTGRDGIHGAGFASKNLSAESEQERSAVQVGDPFKEKLVMEATLECVEKKLVVAIQDMGAAGLVSSSSEMSSSGNVGMQLNLDQVPAREEGMMPFEYLLSESQERMLMVVEPSKEQAVVEVYKKWKLDAVTVGKITNDQRLKVFFQGDLYADLPVHSLTVNKDGAPRYKREIEKPKHIEQYEAAIDQEAVSSLLHQQLEQGNAQAIVDTFGQLLSDPNLASKQLLTEQYDTDIGNARYIGPGQNAGVYKIPETSKGVAVCIDGNGFYITIQPELGSKHNVAEAYRNIIASGSTPIGITNCLNFANPYKKENFYFFEKVVKAMSDAAEFFQIPITGGNVSFYNESEDGPVLPTATLGMVGIIENIENSLPISSDIGDSIYLIGEFKPALGTSLSNYILNKERKGTLPQLDLGSEKKVAEGILQLNRNALLKACIDLSFGGISIAALRMLFATRKIKGACGLSLDLESLQIFSDIQNADLILLGETAHSYLISLHSNDEAQLEEQIKSLGLNFCKFGKFTSEESFRINNIKLSLTELEQSWSSGLNQFFQ